MIHRIWKAFIAFSQFTSGSLPRGWDQGRVGDVKETSRLEARDRSKGPKQGTEARWSHKLRDKNGKRKTLDCLLNCTCICIVLDHVLQDIHGLFILQSRDAFEANLLKHESSDRNATGFAEPLFVPIFVPIKSRVLGAHRTCWSVMLQWKKHSLSHEQWWHNGDIFYISYCPSIPHQSRHWWPQPLAQSVSDSEILSGHWGHATSAAFAWFTAVFIVTGADAVVCTMISRTCTEQIRTAYAGQICLQLLWAPEPKHNSKWLDIVAQRDSAPVSWLALFVDLVAVQAVEKEPDV